MVEVLQKGANCSLLNIAPHLNEIIVAIKWNKQVNDEIEFDIDTSAFMLTEQNKVRNDADFIFYNQTTSSDNAIILKNKLFKITLNGIAKDINKISFVLTLHDAKQKQQHFGMLEKITIELFNFADKQKLISYTLADINIETALILGVLYRYNTEWKFRAMGQGYTNGLAVLARNFGMDIDEPAEQLQNKIAPIANSKIDIPPLADIKTNTNKSNPPSKKTKPKKPKPKKPKPKNSSTKEETAVLDIHNTDMMTKQDHYAPIVQWLQQRNFQAEVNEAAMDTSGFFDEIAVELGNNYELLKTVSDNIKRSQQKKYNNASIFLSKYSPQNIEIIQKFCKQLYDYAFIAKYFHDKKANKIIVRLQAATKIINFFNGEWLEWYAVMKVADLCHQRNIKFSCTRNMIIYLPNDNNKYEIDVFFLINDVPLFIECKSGEYREFIDKYSRLRKKLFMPKPQFLMLTLGVNDEHIKGLTAMFDITFVNENMLLDYVIEFFVKKKPVAIENAKPTKIELPAVNPILKNNTPPLALNSLLESKLETKKTNSNRFKVKDPYAKPLDNRNHVSNAAFLSSKVFFISFFFILVSLLIGLYSEIKN
jgi:stress response protein SCP2